MTASLRDIRVYTTFPHACSYLEGEEATTLFVDPRQTISPELYSYLSQMGFRRSGDHVYRPHCARCKACMPSRVPVGEFERSRSQSRVWKRNQDLVMRESDSIFDDEAWDLYSRYIEARHSDGDMYPPDHEQFKSFLNNGLGCTRYFRFYLPDAETGDERLVMIMVADQMLDGLSAIYTFYDPTEEHRSPGTFAVLYQIELCRTADLPFVYLGYWIQNCGKMNYKARYRPLELLQGGAWQRRERLPMGGDLDRAMPLQFVDNPR